MELKEQISTTVYTELAEFRKTKTYEVIRRVTKYLNDEFWSTNDPTLIFWNISTPRIPHFAKNIDLDTKDFIPYGKGTLNIFQGFCVRKKVERWAKDSKFAITLNDLSDGTSAYGSTIVKLYTNPETKEKELHEVDLTHIAIREKAKSVRESPIVEMNYFSETEIRAYDGAWNNIDDLIKKAIRSNGDEGQTEANTHCDIEVWERWGEVETKDGDIKYMHFIGGGKGDNEVIAFEEEMKPKKNPYYDVHLGKYRGRWLRVGVVERLFKLQERANAVVNQNADATAIASLLLLRSNDSNTTGNVLEQAVNGQIINSADLQQIGITNTAFTLLLNELVTIERQADKLCLTPEVITGESMPSGTPFRSVATLSNSAKSAFTYIKQSIGETIGYLIEEEILPAVVAKWNRGDMIEISEEMEDINLYDDHVITAKKIEYIASKNAQGEVVTEAELIQFEDEVRANLNRIGRVIQIPKGFFNFKFGISLNVTGESIDKSQQNDAYGNIIQWKTANPNVVNDPYFRQYCENNGITPIRMSTKEIQEQVNGMMNGTQPPQKPAVDRLAAMVNS